MITIPKMPSVLEHTDLKNILSHLDIIQYEQHVFLRESLKNIKKVFDRAIAEEKDDISLHKCREIFLELCEEVEVHFKEEEAILFPLIRKMEGDDIITNDDSKTIESLVHVLEYENNHSETALLNLKEACHKYSFCPQTFYEYNHLMILLQQFERDLREHARTETQHLYPAAIRKEKLLSFIPVKHESIQSSDYLN